jgi:predicted  nucleic acid-binding Zn-ribbon protein
MKLLLFLSAAFAARGSLVQRPCSCEALVQETDAVSRPRDCTCITGMKTYPTTPRDELKAMGPVALRKHLAKVKAEVEDLRKQKVEMEEELETQKKTADEKIEKVEKAYEKQKKDASAEKADTKGEIAKLKEKCDKQETKLSNLKNEYNSKYSDFYELQKKMGSAMMVMASCDCKAGDEKGSFLATSKAHLSPEQEQMYDQIREVDKYETEAKDIQEFLTEAQTEASYHQNRGIEQTDTIQGRMEYHAHVSKKLDFKNMLEPLEKRADALDQAVKDEQSYVDKYAERNKKLDDKIKALKKELKDCGC